MSTDIILDVCPFIGSHRQQRLVGDDHVEATVAGEANRDVFVSNTEVLDQEVKKTGCVLSCLLDTVTVRGNVGQVVVVNVESDVNAGIPFVSHTPLHVSRRVFVLGSERFPSCGVEISSEAMGDGRRRLLHRVCTQFVFVGESPVPIVV